MNQAQHCWYKLNIKSTENAINKSWGFPTVNGNYGIWDLQDKSIFNKEWLDHLKQLGLAVDHIMLFYRGPGLNRTTAHIDVVPPATDILEFTTGALNFVLNGKDSDMVWYETPATPKKVNFTPANTPYLDWPITSLKEIDRARIGEELVLVRTNVPHTVLMREDPRWCISARIAYNHKISWEDTVDQLRSMNLIIER